MELSNGTLNELPQNIIVPNYDRSALRPGIIHVGVGNFHRAHQAWYLHRLMQVGEAHDWAIIGAGVRNADAIMREKLLRQDCLTTLIELDPLSSSVEVVGSMIDYIPIEENNKSLILRMARSDIRIVALTVTEGGYFIDPATKCFDEDHPDIVFDARNPDAPKTVFGAIVAALKIRRDTGAGPVTGLSCDNLQGNGDILRQAVVSLARMLDGSLANWIDVNCTFPNSMVDCIVPATGPEEIAIANQHGVADCVPVTHENFRQWVIEDNFCAGRPDWQKVGVQFADAVHDFEMMKIRILNGGHQVISVPAEVLSVSTIADCMAHDLIGRLFIKVTLNEIVPHVKAVPGMSPVDYLTLIQGRFANAKIEDTTRRVAFDGSSRHPCFILPSIRDGLEAGTSIEGLALVEATWARMCFGTRADGSLIDPNDPNWSDLQTKAQEARSDPRTWLDMQQIYGTLRDEPRFSKIFSNWLNMIWDQGLEATIHTYLKT
jgi:mannitol 2-dehydrogenase